MIGLLAVTDATRLVHLAGIDLVIIVSISRLALAIGFYLKGPNAGVGFFMAGREMTAWIAHFAFRQPRLVGIDGLGLGRPVGTEFSRRIGIGSARFPRCCSSPWS
jgi:hypothetical protein